MEQRNLFVTRSIYFKKIENYIDDSLIKVLIGQRRVGKSFILFQTIETIKKKHKNADIIYINKEDYKFDDIKTYSDLIKYVAINKKTDSKTYLFIDEIQDIEDFEKALRHFQTTGEYDIYCTGSNATLLSGELATYLAGRYIAIRVFSLTYVEFLEFQSLKDSNENFLSYIKFGGMPHLINLKNDESVYFEYLNNLMSTIVLKDIVARYKIRNVNFMQDLIRFLADNLGSIVSAKRISNFLKSQKINVQSKIVLEYLYYLETVYFVEKVNRTEIQGRKIFEIGSKFYFEDLGMRHSILPYKLQDISKIFENVVYHHLRVHNYEVFVGKQGDKEIDFVAQKNGLITYIQVCYIIQDEKTHQREFGNLLSINDNYPKMVISMDELAEGNYQGVQHWNIRKFLMEFN